MADSEAQKRRIKIRSKLRSDADLRAIARVIIELALADTNQSTEDEGQQEKPA